MRRDFRLYLDDILEAIHQIQTYLADQDEEDPCLFDEIVEVLKTEPDRVLFIDDDIGNVDRAKQKGWKGILYVDRDSFQKDIKKKLLPLKS